MSSRRRVILFELNEVPWRIVDHFVETHPTSTLAAILPAAHQFSTVAADVGHLSPWTTWPTLHRGVNDEQHLIANFGQDLRDVDAQYPPVWELLRRRGVSVGICGTLHSYPPPPDVESYSFYLPDTFASGPEAFPDELEVFQRFNLRMARESARNVDTSIPLEDAARFLASTPAIGITPKTFAALASQLVAERRHPGRSTRRRTFQAVLAFDLYAKQLRARRPAFSSFFTNHVASAMHRYWAATFPGDYDSMDLGPEWVERYRDEVPWAMRQADEMLSRLVAFVREHPGYQLWVTSSMGQGPTMAQELETQLYLLDPARFMGAVGVVPDGGWEQKPSMAPQRNVWVAPEHRDAFAALLDDVRVAGEPLGYRRAADGLFSMDWGQPNLHDAGEVVTVRGQLRSFSELGLRVVEIEDRSDTTAYHVPEGVLAVHDPTAPAAPGAARTEVSALAVAPALLRAFGVEPAPYMRDPGPLAPLVSS